MNRPKNRFVNRPVIGIENFWTKSTSFSGKAVSGNRNEIVGNGMMAICTSLVNEGFGGGYAGFGSSIDISPCLPRLTF